MKLFAVVLFSLVSFSAHAENTRLSLLTALHNEYVAAVSYLNICAGGYLQNVKLHPFFHSNGGIIAVALSEELQSKMGATPEKAGNAILKKTEVLKTKWQKAFQEKGCNSAEALAAKGVFDKFSPMPPNQMMNLVDKIGR